MAGISAPSDPKHLESPKQNYLLPLVVLTTLFFMWGFITSMNDVMVPFFKKSFELSAFSAGLVQFFFFFAYFAISFLYFIISSNLGDPISKIGYKNGIIVGLLTAAVGACIFYPAAEAQEYWVFLLAFFILAAGVTILQMAANPYVALLGRPETSSSRLNMTQAFNSLGTTVAPVIGSILIFESVGATSDAGVTENAGLDVVKTPYLMLAGLLLLLTVFIGVSKLPKIQGEKIEKGLTVLKFSHLTLGLLGIFMYVGGEASIGTFLANYLEANVGFREEIATKFISLYWGGAMVGRFIGALSLSDSKNKVQQYGLIALIAILAVVAVFFFMESVLAKYAITNITSMEVSLIMLGFIAFNIVAFQLGSALPGRTLGVFALINCALLVTSVSTEGYIAMFSVVAVGLFNSIMFPTIFTLAIKGLGKYTSQGSSLLVMAIVGGAIVTTIMGWLIDLTNYQVAYLLPIICYGYISYYGFKGHKVKMTAEDLKDKEGSSIKPKESQPA